MSARPIFHMATIARYQMVSNIQIRTSPFAGLVGRNTIQKVRLTLKNKSYVTIPAEKLEALIETDCPPTTSVMMENVCIEYGGDCKECWKSWLIESEDNHE